MSEIGYSAFDRYSPTFISSLQSTRGFIVVLWVLDDFTKVTTWFYCCFLGKQVILQSFLHWTLLLSHMTRNLLIYVNTNAQLQLINTFASKLTEIFLLSRITYGFGTQSRITYNVNVAIVLLFDLYNSYFHSCTTYSDFRIKHYRDIFWKVLETFHTLVSV